MRANTMFSKDPMLMGEYSKTLKSFKFYKIQNFITESINFNVNCQINKANMNNPPMSLFSLESSQKLHSASQISEPFPL
jgi:hypothetical protein